MKRKLVLGALAISFLAGAPIALPQAPRVTPVTPPPTSPAVAPPLTIPNLEPTLKAPVIAPVQPRPVTAPLGPRVVMPGSGLAGSSSEPRAAASPPPGAESADLPQAGAGYDPCLHPTNPPSYCKQEPE